MSGQIQALRQHLEDLFPGQWLHGDKPAKNLLTGIDEIDCFLTKGLARQQITEWFGLPSSGKTTVLRMVITNLCRSGFNVAYIDTLSKLEAYDWAFVRKANSGRFWIVRFEAVGQEPLTESKQLLLDAFFSAEQFLKSQAFDLVVVDLDRLYISAQLASRIYVRMKRVLAQSKSALVLCRSGTQLYRGEGSYARIEFGFRENNIDCLRDFSGVQKIALSPFVNLTISKNGQSQAASIAVVSHVANRLFTHSPISDRRTTKA